MLWWPGIVAVVLIVFWCLMLFVFGGSINMILHSYYLSYNKRHQFLAKLTAKGIDGALLLSIIYLIGAIAYYIMKLRE